MGGSEDERPPSFEPGDVRSDPRSDPLADPGSNTDAGTVWPDPSASLNDAGDAFSPSFRLTMAFLKRYPRYRETLALTPEHYRFDRVLWSSSLATLRQLLASVAESQSLAVSASDIDEALRNLVEGIVLRGQAWNG